MIFITIWLRERIGTHVTFHYFSPPSVSVGEGGRIGSPVHTKFSDAHGCMLNHFSCLWLLASLWIVAHQAPLSVGFSRQYWSGLPFPPPGDLPDPGVEPLSLESPALTGVFFTTSTTWEAPLRCSSPSRKMA